MALLQTIAQMDIRASNWIFQSRRHARLVPFCKLLSRTADGWLYVVSGLLLIWLNRETGLHFARLVLLAFAVERLLYLTIKNIYRRRRPAARIPGFESVLTASDRFSLPSGHTSGAFLMATLCFVTFGPAAAAIYLWAMLVACSRVVLGMHFVTDVLLGACLGAGTALLSRSLLGP